MAWTERQRAMLQAMGLRVWQRAQLDPNEASEASEAFEPFEASKAADATDAKAARGTAPAAAATATATTTTTTTTPSARPAGGGALPPAPAPAAAPLGPRRPAGGLDLPLRPSPLALDWPALREAVAACQACSLHQTRTQTVFGVGHPRAHWMVIGEAPGAEEDRQGEPFVGAAGQLLDAMLRALGLSRAEDAAPEQAVYIANTLKCRPPGNRNPGPEEMARCEPFLLRQIALVQPRLILAMGRFAIQALLRSSEPVGRLRGQVHQVQGVPLVVTYHPAYLLRTPADKAKAWDDLCLAASVMDGLPPPAG